MQITCKIVNWLTFKCTVNKGFNNLGPRVGFLVFGFSYHSNFSDFPCVRLQIYYFGIKPVLRAHKTPNLVLIGTYGLSFCM